MLNESFNIVPFRHPWQPVKVENLEFTTTMLYSNCKQSGTQQWQKMNKAVTVHIRTYSEKRKKKPYEING